MHKAIFLDRDGTINKEKHYLYKIEEFEFLPGVVKGIRVLQDCGYIIIIITNQSGIARGYYTEKEYRQLNEWMIKKLERQGVHITAEYYCPHLPDAAVARYRKDCECRKPKLGLYRRAIDDYDIDLDNSYAIGDRIRDCSICEHSLCKGFLIGKNEKKDVIKRVTSGAVERVRYCEDLFKATEIIQRDR